MANTINTTGTEQSRSNATAYRIAQIYAAALIRIARGCSNPGEVADRAIAKGDDR